MLRAMSKVSPQQDVSVLSKAKNGLVYLTANDWALIADKAVRRQFKAGETIFKEGDPATELYCVQSGRVGLHLGARLVLTVEPNGPFGIISLIENEPRGATAIAETDVTLAVVSEKAFLFCVSETPNFALKVMRALARQLRAELLSAH